VTKKVYVWSGTNYSATAQTDLRFLYNGWNLLAELNSTNGVTHSYIWGSDLSGTPHGAGGIGGFLAFTDISSTVTRHFACYDGSGNIIALVKLDGSTSAQYEYGPFGEIVRASGAIALSNPFRFSTKFADDESNLIYYGSRYLTPTTGCWPNRDPIAE
jgi:RHS repeat-associated protein